jgi:hypothetical protein
MIKRERTNQTPCLHGSAPIVLPALKFHPVPLPADCGSKGQLALCVRLSSLTRARIDTTSHGRHRGADENRAESFCSPLRFYAESPEITSLRQWEKDKMAKKWSLSLRQPIRNFFALRFFCQSFFDFMQTPTMTVNLRRRL